MSFSGIEGEMGREAPYGSRESWDRNERGGIIKAGERATL